SAGAAVGNHVAFAPDGTVIAAGRTLSSASFSSSTPLEMNAEYIVSFDPNAQRQHVARWATSLTTSDYLIAFIEEGGLAVGPDGSAIVSGPLTRASAPLGSFELPASDGTDAVFARIDATGAPRWLVSFGGAGDQTAPRAIFDAHGRLFVAFQQYGDRVELGGA